MSESQPFAESTKTASDTAPPLYYAQSARDPTHTTGGVGLHLVHVTDRGEKTTHKEARNPSKVGILLGPCPAVGTADGSAKIATGSPNAKRPASCQPPQTQD